MSNYFVRASINVSGWEHRVPDSPPWPSWSTPRTPSFYGPRARPAPGCLTCADTNFSSPYCWIGFFAGVLLSLVGISLAWVCARRCRARDFRSLVGGAARLRPQLGGRSPTPVRRPPPSPATPPENLAVPGLPVPLLGRHDLANRQSAPEPAPSPTAGYLPGYGAVPGANDGGGRWRTPCRECGLEQPGHPGHLCPLRGTNRSLMVDGLGFWDPAVRPGPADPQREPRGQTFAALQRGLHQRRP